MKASNFFHLRLLINFAFLVMMAIFLVVTLTDKEYDRDDIMLLLLYREAIVLVLQTIVNAFLKTIPVFPDMPMLSHEERKDGR